MHLPNGLPDDLPEDFAAATARFSFAPAEPQQAASFDKPVRIGGTSDAMLERVWAPAKKRYQEMHERIRGATTEAPREIPAGLEAAVGVAATGRRLLGIAGRAGSGKTSVAGMIPGATTLQLADPLYAMLATMLGLPEPILRQREFKESEIPWLGKSVRCLLQTLGTEWGRQHVCPDVWIRHLERRVELLAEQGVTVIAVADVRFDNEVDYLRSMGAEIWHVRRPGEAVAGEHSSEAGVTVRPTDVVIENAGSLEDLRLAVLKAFGHPSPAVAHE